EKATGLHFDPARLDESLEIYNEHNAVMRELSETLAGHSEILISQRSDIFKSAFFMLKEEHTSLVRSFLNELKAQPAGAEKIRIMITGILADAPAFTGILDEYGMQVAADDVAAESRQYRVDAPKGNDPLDRLVQKFRALDNCSVLYDPEKKRIGCVVEEAKARKACGILVILTKFCDPEEFDYPLIKRACDANKIPCIIVEVDRQMVNYEQARTVIETFRDLLAQKQIVTGV
ncbi:MAG: 2-hydroxyacyl-CoA dehydratase family protein, partial [Treponema sp.]|nr:2-hydroxyacyl-CoA dehydratase family protein [Treponema sp.]